MEALPPRDMWPPMTSPIRIALHCIATHDGIVGYTAVGTVRLFVVAGRRSGPLHDVTE